MQDSCPWGTPVTGEGRCLNKEPTSQEQMSVCHKDEELDSLNPEAEVGRPTGAEKLGLWVVTGLPNTSVRDRQTEP